MTEEIRKRLPAAVFLLREYWLEIGSLEDYERAQVLFNTAGAV
jgi:NDP-sugar pyrophosphorylase family protein